MRRAVFVALAAVLLLPPNEVRGQFWEKLTNPKIGVPVSHPPGLGLQVNRVAFGPAKGAAAEEFMMTLAGRFVDADIEVIERQQLDLLLAEQDFSLTGRVDSTSATALGDILGPAVLIFVDIPRYQVTQKRLHEDWRDGKGRRHRTYISRTQAFAKGSVRAVDLATGRIFKAARIEAKPLLENRLDDDCCAEFPPEFDLQDLAMNELVGQAHRLFLPWTEMTDVYFFDDKDCNLKTAHGFLKSGNVEVALQQSLTNLENCKAKQKVKDKTLAHAYHNVGIGYFATGELDLALENLNAAQRVKSADIHAEAIGECLRAATLAEQMQEVETQMALDEGLGVRQAAVASAASSAEITSPPTAVAAPPNPASGNAGPDAPLEERLQKLNDLKEKGLITQDEYDDKRAELLAEL